jgi:hypothetical protein
MNEIINNEMEEFIRCKRKVKQSRYRSRGPRGFQEVKFPRFHNNGTGWW